MTGTGRIKIVIIVGPTASGKSRLAIELARVFDGEVVSADSMQVYKGMDIGTARPSPAERGAVPHHLMDIVDPDCDYTAARFREDAAAAINDIDSRGKRAFVVGGTGLYIRALTEGLFEGPGEDHRFRDGLKKEAAEHGGQSLHRKLAEVDPVSASRTHPNNTHRVVRALEVYHLTGRPISELQAEHGFGEEPFDLLKIGLVKEREALYRDIDGRVDGMMEAGLLAEVCRLIDAGYGAGYKEGLKSMQGLGYKEMLDHVAGGCTLEEAVRLLKRNTRHYAKRQMTWFKKDKDIRWFTSGESSVIIPVVREYFAVEVAASG
ncbi:MAG: tRNA (adenosine(37)-N6)-dimethylallyltransferase MiaA [Thermodesulfobacteriota bacterium]